MKETRLDCPPSVSTGISNRNSNGSKRKSSDSRTKRLHKGVRKGRKHPESQTELTDNRFSTVYVSPSGVRKPFSVRIDTAIKEAWMRFCLEKGLDSCEIVEKVFLGIMAGYNAPVYASHTVNVIVDFPKVVKRVRRRQIYWEDEEVEVSGEYSPGPLDVQPEIRCEFCGRSAVGLAESVQGRKVFVCDVHRKELRQHQKWKVI